MVYLKHNEQKNYRFSSYWNSRIRLIEHDIILLATDLKWKNLLNVNLNRFNATGAKICIFVIEKTFR